jgi:hypothetical protein
MMQRAVKLGLASRAEVQKLIVTKAVSMARHKEQ